ncbi:MAG: FtsX-like permease family protein [Candidatus Korarchaeota archaeon]|nr:FtsX-like permease family protein [Candidatus Korarchaeota archaeon]
MGLLLLAKRLLIRSGNKAALSIISISAGIGLIAGALGIWQSSSLFGYEGEFFIFLSKLSRPLLVLGISSFALGIIFIFYAIYHSVMKSKSTIGILKTIGYPKKAILNLYLLQGFLLGFIGSLIGVTLASNFIISFILGGGYYISHFVAGYLLSNEVNAILFIVGMFTPVVASYFPAKKAAEYPIRNCFMNIDFDPERVKFVSNDRLSFLYLKRKIMRNYYLYILLILISTITLSSIEILAFFWSIENTTNSYTLPRYYTVFLNRVYMMSQLLLLLTGLLGFFAIWRDELRRRRKEIGILKTVGWTNRNVGYFIFLELSFIVFTGYILSTIITNILIIVISKFFEIFLVIEIFKNGIFYAMILFMFNYAVAYSIGRKKINVLLKELEEETLEKWM